MADDKKLTRIDDSNRADHTHLTAGDECYFCHEYTSHKNYSYGKTNNLISNLKKKPSQSNVYEKKYKALAIAECADFFSKAINPKWIKDATLVPLPPSKAVGHDDYDDRIKQICSGIQSEQPLDIRQLVIQTVSLPAGHVGGPRPSVQDLLSVYQIDENLTVPAPTKLAIFDDVLTAGTHFRAAHTILSARFPNVPIVGFFVARRIFPSPFEEFEVEL